MPFLRLPYRIVPAFWQPVASVPQKLCPVTVGGKRTLQKKWGRAFDGQKRQAAKMREQFGKAAVNIS
jgi:hypothetical protein